MRKPFFGPLLILLVGALFEAVTPLVGNAAANQLPPWVKAHSLPLYGAFAAIIITLAVVEFFREQRSASGPDEKFLARERADFLSKLHERYAARLKDGLESLVLITLHLHELPSAIARPTLVERESTISSDERAVPTETSLIDIYIHAERQLLVLGVPGVGKTIALLTLAQALVDRATTSAEEPLPVVFDLATWPGKEIPLEQWLEAQLQRVYDVPHATAEQWVKLRQLALLLDGFDEVAPSARADCLKTLNRFHTEHGLTHLVVCSRKQVYEEQPERLDLHKAVLLQPLSTEQVDNYLHQGGERLAALREFVQRETLTQVNDQEEEQENSLSTLFQVPLFLNMAILAYEGATPEQISAPTERDQWVRLLFHKYVLRMLQRRLSPQQKKGKKESRYTEKETSCYLRWLAQQMQRPDHEMSIFYLEDLQPNWLPDEATLARFRRLTALAGGLSIGLITGLCFGLFGGPGGMLGGMVVGMVVGTLFGALNSDQEVKLSELIDWSWTSLGVGLYVWFIFGLYSGLFFVLIGGLGAGLLGDLFGGLYVGLCFGLVVVLFFVLKSRARTAKDRRAPGQGFHRSLKHGIIVGLVAGLVSGLYFGLGAEVLAGRGADMNNGLIVWLNSGLGAGPYFGLDAGLVTGSLVWLIVWLSAGLYFGGWPAFKHFVLRVQLRRSGVIPHQYATFLEFCAHHLLLQQVGGGFRFVHLSLRDYFAELPEKGQVG